MLNNSDPLSSLPKHVAIIMDGNRRWAKSKRLPYSNAYEYSINAIEEAITGAIDLNIKYLTLFALSIDNLQRNNSEINVLKLLIKKYLKKNINYLINNNIKLRIIGDYFNFSRSIAKQLENIIQKTENNYKLNLTIALNYSGQFDILYAINNIIKNKNLKMITYDDISNNLYTNGIPNPDILIRTGGDQRISNFLLWQLAYTELFFIKEGWPDFKKEHLQNIIKEFASRERRYGR